MNESQELIWDAAPDDMLDLLYQEDKKQGHQGQLDGYRNQGLRHSELGLLHVDFTVGITVLVHLNDLVEDAMLAARLYQTYREKATIRAIEVAWLMRRTSSRSPPSVSSWWRIRSPGTSGTASDLRAE